MTDNSSVNNASNIEASRTAQESNETSKQQSSTDQVKDQCYGDLKSSSSKKENNIELDKNHAVEKLSFQKELTSDVGLKAKIDNLIEMVRQVDPKQVTQFSDLQELIDKAFQKPAQMFQTDSEFAVTISNAVAENPFHVNNPFAPKPVSKSNSTSQIDWQKQNFSEEPNSSNILL